MKMCNICCWRTETTRDRCGCGGKLIEVIKASSIPGQEHYSENPNRKVYNIDFDHTITADAKGTYSKEPLPRLEMIEKIKEKYISGEIIIIWTARHWDNAPFLAAWLTKHSVPHHGLKMAKGGSDFYIDDKCLSVEDFLNGTES